MIHDGKLRGVETIGSGFRGIAWAVSNQRAELEALHREDLCDEPTVGGTVAWVALLEPEGIQQIELLR